MNYFLLKLDVDSVFVQGSGRPIFAQLLQVLWTFHSKAHYMSGLELSKTQLELEEKLDEIFFVQMRRGQKICAGLSKAHFCSVVADGTLTFQSITHYMFGNLYDQYKYHKS